jgi:hypothetical protein
MARKDISLANYTAVDDREKELLRQATSQIGNFQDVLTLVQQEKAEADGTVDRNRLFLLMAMTLGSSFLLAANLISTREEPAEPAASPAKAADDRVTELTTAAYLIEVALEQARGLDERKPGA